MRTSVVIVKSKTLILHHSTGIILNHVNFGHGYPVTCLAYFFQKLKKNKDFDIFNPDEEMVCFTAHSLGYDVVDEMSKELPKVIEYLLERDVWYAINR